jgi:hypothetical protein
VITGSPFDVCDIGGCAKGAGMPRALFRSNCPRWQRK